MADSRSLRRSRRLQRERPEVELGESPPRVTPLQGFKPTSFILDKEARESEQSVKRRRIELLSVEEESDSLADD